MRQAAIAQAAAKSVQGRAPAWLYLFGRNSPVLDGRARAFHCADIPYAFNNTDRCASMTGGDAQARRVGNVICDAWVRFARTGNPNHPALPAWSPYDNAGGSTMIFADNSRVASHPDRDELGALEAATS